MGKIYNFALTMPDRTPEFVKSFYEYILELSDFDKIVVIYSIDKLSRLSEEFKWFAELHHMCSENDRYVAEFYDDITHAISKDPRLSFNAYAVSPDKMLDKKLKYVCDEFLIRFKGEATLYKK